MGDPCCVCYHAIVGFLVFVICLIILAILTNGLVMTYYTLLFLYLILAEEFRLIKLACVEKLTRFRCRQQCKCCIRSNPVRNDKVVPVGPSPIIMVRNPDNSLQLGKIGIV